MGGFPGSECFEMSILGNGSREVIDSRSNGALEFLNGKGTTRGGKEGTEWPLLTRSWGKSASICRSRPFQLRGVGLKCDGAAVATAH